MASTQENRAQAARPIRVVIVGGGCAGLAAAWELSKQNPDDEHSPAKFEIAVYEKSWRLGGKGASVRDEYGRIREHGLHVWMGFYENAFRLMRECYKRIPQNKKGPYDSIEKAFFPEPRLGAALQNRAGQWIAWTGYFPPAKGEPGTDLDVESNPFSFASYLARMLSMVKTLMQSVIAPHVDGAYEKNQAAGRSTLDTELATATDGDPTASPNAQIKRLAQLLRVGSLVTAAALLQSIAILRSILLEQSAQTVQSLGILKYLEAIATHSRDLLTDVVNVDEEIRRRTEIIDLVMTIVVGLYRDKVLFDPRGLDALDDIDCKDWLRKHGALPTSVESPFVRGLYDLAFAYRDGDKRFPALAAGQALRGWMRMFFSYRGEMVWRMRAGMGDVVFSPLYRALRARGVKFHFNHTLTKTRFNSDLSDKAANRVTGLEFEVAYEPNSQSAEWSALDDQGHFWPASVRKRFQTRTGPNVTLVADAADAQGFDAVVFALGKDDFVKACNDLCAGVDRYRQMAKHVTTVATQAAQLWFKDDIAEVGWDRGSVIMTNRPSNLDSWADMAHILAAERGVQYRQEAPAKAVIYLCGVLPQKIVDAAENEYRTYPEEERKKLVREALNASVKKDARDFLVEWKALERLVSPKKENEAAFEDQHFQANYEGSERYALSLPGTLRHRVSPLDDSVENMTIAGDWTDCGFNEGCVEAAVMSGRLAAHALTGDCPSLDDIVGYNHP